MGTANSINLTGAGVVSYNGAGLFIASPITQYSPLIGGASHAIVSLGPLTDGKTCVGRTGLAPLASSITAGQGITVANGPGTIVIGTTGMGMGWSEPTTSPIAMTPNSAYITGMATLLTFTLPNTSATVVLEIVGKGSGGWLISVTGSQVVRYGTLTLTAGNTIASTNRYDCIRLRCVTTNTEWVVERTIGNLVVV